MTPPPSKDSGSLLTRTCHFHVRPGRFPSTAVRLAHVQCGFSVQVLSHWQEALNLRRLLEACLP